MEKKKITEFPKGFFQIKRKVITASEALRDTIPFEWEEKKEIEVQSSQEKNVTTNNESINLKH